MTGMLIWKPHLGTLANSFIILALMGWLCLLWYRYRSRYAVPRTMQLLAPKLFFAVLAVVAFMDPAWRNVKPTDDSLKVAVISDVSTSMDVKDDGATSRAARAQRIAKNIRSELRGIASVEDYQFDVDLLTAKDALAEGTRRTDLGKTIVAISESPVLADCRAVVLVTDGGDEAIRFERLPEVPIFIAGIGTDSSTWDDLEISNTDIPEEVELDTPFRVSADIVVHQASAAFSTQSEELDVRIERRVADKYEQLDAVKMESGTSNRRVEFELPAEETEGVYHYRLSVKGVEGEMTILNNAREFAVDIREKSIKVLLFGNMLDWNFAMLKREFSDDATIKLTSVYRKNAEVFLIDGARQEGDQVFSQGFPADEEVLDLYTCIVLGSFPAEFLGPESCAALNKYVERGGNLVLLGGPKSFDKGGYYKTDLAPLIPWKESNHTRGISAGQFPVVIPPEGSGHGLSSATSAILKDVPAPMFYSVNHVGQRRGGALSLMNASVGNEIVPIVALQPYGRGQTLGVATDTLWRWSRMEGDISGAFSQFWRDSIRYLAGDIEGGRFLTVGWDRKRYLPGEEAHVEIGVVGRYAEGEVYLMGTVEHAGTTEDLSIVLKDGNDFQTKVFFPDRGDYKVKLEATLAGEPLDTYERVLRVGSSVSEGANLAVDHPFLENLAAHSGGSYQREADTDQLIQRLKATLMASADPHDSPLVRDPALFGVLPVYILLVMGVLLWEWVLRRRLKIV